MNSIFDFLHFAMLGPTENLLLPTWKRALAVEPSSDLLWRAVTNNRISDAVFLMRIGVAEGEPRDGKTLLMHAMHVLDWNTEMAALIAAGASTGGTPQWSSPALFALAVGSFGCALDMVMAKAPRARPQPLRQDDLRCLAYNAAWMRQAYRNRDGPWDADTRAAFREGVPLDIFEQVGLPSGETCFNLAMLRCPELQLHGDVWDLADTRPVAVSPLTLEHPTPSRRARRLRTAVAAYRELVVPGGTVLPAEMLLPTFATAFGFGERAIRDVIAADAAWPDAG